MKLEHATTHDAVQYCTALYHVPAESKDHPFRDPFYNIGRMTRDGGQKSKHVSRLIKKSSVKLVRRSAFLYFYIEDMGIESV